MFEEGRIFHKYIAIVRLFVVLAGFTRIRDDLDSVTTKSLTESFLDQGRGNRNQRHVEKQLEGLEEDPPKDIVESIEQNHL